MEEDSSEDKLEDYIIQGLEIMKKFRGEVIERCLQIEHVLDDILANYFSKENKEKNDQFREDILGSEFCTMHTKIKIFKELKIHKHKRFGDEYKGLSGKLFNFNDARNSLAHNLKDSYHHEFLMNWKGKKEVVKLDNDFLQEIDDEFQIIIRSLLIITKDSGLMINWLKQEELFGKKGKLKLD